MDTTVNVPVQKVVHLAQLVRPRRAAGSEVIRSTPLERCPTLASVQDCTAFTPTAPEGQYVCVSLAGKAINALYDTGSNYTIVSRTLARKLGLLVHEYEASFR